MVEFVMFPPEVLALQEELKNHPALMAQLSALPLDVDLGEKLGTIAAFCGIVLDDVYNEKDLLRLCDILVRELKKATTELIEDVSKPIPQSPTVH